MAIDKIDKNFDLRQKINVDGAKVYDIPSKEFSLFGVYFDAIVNRFVRMDSKVAGKISAGVCSLNMHTAGGRLCFSTDSSFLQLAVQYSVLTEMMHMPLTGSAGFSLFEITEQGERHIGNFAPANQTAKKGYVASVSLGKGGMRQYVLYFPLYNQVNRLSLALEGSAKVEPWSPYRDVAPILYYGSSITQGGCASRPDNSYQALICKRNKIDFINLGFSGSARAEKEMVEYLGGINCSLFVCDYDHNAPSVEYLAATHFALYQQFRKAQPTTPILFLSRPDIYRGNEGGIEREKIVRGTYLKAKRQGDNNVYFLSGKSFYGKKPFWDFAVDGCHPTDYGFAVMADKIYKKMLTIDKKFGEEND